MEEIYSNIYNYSSKKEYLNEAKRLLHKYFGFNEFRVHQLECIEKLWDNDNCLILSPTGSGKSLCYSIPALLGNGLTIVITPLISLMEDQVRNLKNKGIAAERFHSNIDLNQKKEIIESIKNQRLKILYISPERFSVLGFRNLLLKYSKIDIIAIDEAHCICDWGYFRNEYKNIGLYTKDFKAKKILLTATLTQDKLEYIKNLLDIKDINIINVEGIRSNLIIKNFVFYKEEEKIINIVNHILKETGSGIIYTCTRKKVEEIYKILTQKFNISCCKFHGGMNIEEKERSFKYFMENKIKIMVATKAFGMGIDKSDIRFVYHANIPSCLEDYFQEIGRAGRDGLNSNTFLFYTNKDLNIQKHMIDLSFPSKFILNYFKKLLDSFYDKEKKDTLNYDDIVYNLINIVDNMDRYYIEKILDLFIKHKIYILDESRKFIQKNETLHKKDLKDFHRYVEKEKFKNIYKLQKMIEYLNISEKELKDKFYLNYFKINNI